MRHRIYLVEDHPIYRGGLVSYIDEQPELIICGEAEDVAGALEGIERTNPHLVIIDLQLKKSSGFSLIQELRARWPHLRLLVLTMYDEVRYADRLLQAGVSGYLMKDKGPKTVLEAIHSILQGTPYASERVKAQMLLHGTRDSPMEMLTDRELEIYQMIGEGRQVAEIAEILHRSAKTIHNHIDNIKNKLQLHSRQDFYQMARDWVTHSDHM